MTHAEQLHRLKVFVTQELDWVAYQRDQYRLRLRIERRVRVLERKGLL